MKRRTLYLAAIRSTLRTALPLVLVGVVALLIVIRCGKIGASMAPVPPRTCPGHSSGQHGFTEWRRQRAWSCPSAAMTGSMRRLDSIVQPFSKEIVIN